MENNQAHFWHGEFCKQSICLQLVNRSKSIREEKKMQLIPDFPNIEKPTFCSYVRLVEVLDAVDGGGTISEGNAVIVRLSYAANDGDIGFGEGMLHQI